MDRTSHDERQRQIFNNPATISQFTQPLPADVEQVRFALALLPGSALLSQATVMPTLLVTPVQRLARIAQAVPGLGPGSRIIDVGSGTGCLIPHFQMQGVQDILAVDLADNMLEQLRKRFGAKTTLGNEAGVNQHQLPVADMERRLHKQQHAARTLAPVS